MGLLNFEKSGNGLRRYGFVRKPGLLLLPLFAASLALASYTFAGGISINGGDSGSGSVTFGQGVAQTMACDNEISITPNSSFRNGTFYLSSIDISGIDSTIGHCQNKDFLFQIYSDSSGTPIDFVSGINLVKVYDDGSNFSVQDYAGITITQPSGDNSQFTIHFNPSSTPVASASISRITIESSEHQGGMSCSPGPTNSWTKIYEIENPVVNGSNGFDYSSGFGLGSSDVASILNQRGGTIHRIRYRVEAQRIRGGAGLWTDMSFDCWSGVSVDQLQIPDLGSHQFAIQRNVANLDVSSNSDGVTTGTSLNGRLEIWPWNYDTQNSGLTPAGDSSTYDYDDTYYQNGYYGSFQVHDLTHFKTVFAWNNHRSSIPDFGFGQGGANPDWTFDHSFMDTVSSWKLQIFVG